MKVLVLGASGMLGSTVFNFLKQDSALHVVGTSSAGGDNLTRFNVKTDALHELLFKNIPDFIINCIGIIKPEINESIESSVENAISINSIFPRTLYNAAESSRIIQIATDCVYQGLSGDYLENSLHDATDVYGKTKSLGEIHGENFLNLRCSIIGREINKKKSLIEWVLSQQRSASLTGYDNHSWNGVTTLTFSKVVHGIITSSESHFDSSLQHLVPSNIVTKFELLCKIRSIFDRNDLTIHSAPAPISTNRTLSTNFATVNKNLWQAANYVTIPSVQDMLDEYMEWLAKKC